MYAPVVDFTNEDLNLSEEEMLEIVENLEHLKGNDKILSYKKIYSGDMYDFITFSHGAHASISNMTKFPNGETALIHIEDGKGAYTDFYFPSYEVISGNGHSDVMSRLIRHAKGAKKSLHYLIRKRKKALMGVSKNVRSA